jgi:HD-like signal output (HDOD) protein
MTDFPLPPPTEEIRRRLLRLKEIPPPNAMAREIIRVAGDEQVDIEAVVRLINQSPQLAGRILRVANSAYYGHCGKILSVEQAVIRVLGLSMTKSLILALALTTSFKWQDCPHFRADRHWFLAILTANLAQALAPCLDTEGKPLPATAYTAGLVHNLGVLALVHLFPEQMRRVFALEEGLWTEKMLDLLELDHHLAGSWLAKTWGLPEELIRAIAFYGDPSYLGPFSPLTHLVGFCATAAEKIHAGDFPGRWRPSFPDPPLFTEDDFAEVMERTTPHLEDLKALSQLLAGKRE